MASSTDTPAESVETITEVTTDDREENTALSETSIEQNEAAEDTIIPLQADRHEEVPALLGGSTVAENNAPEMVPEPVATIETTASTDGLDSEHVAESTCTTPQDQYDNGIELRAIQEALKDSLTHTHYISTKIDAVTVDTDCLIKQVNTLSTRYDVLTAEIESNTSASSTKQMLSKTFLTIASTALAVLVIAQIYMFTALVKTQQTQYTTGSAVLGNISGLNKKMADYNKNLTKALENPAQQGHTLQKQDSAEIAAHLSSGNTEVGSTTVLEKLNKLRNGQPEKKLIRKETGDWFVYNSKKSEECIADVEIIEALNLSFKKIGKSLTPALPLPAHNAVCLLKPDGKGGTEIVMTKAFLP